MGLQISIPGTKFTNYADLLNYPVLDALSSLFYLGGSQASAIVNHATGFGNATAAGGSTIAYQPNYARFTGNHTLNTGYLQTQDRNDASNEFTFISLTRIVGDGDRASFGSVDSAGAGAMLLTANAFAFGSSTPSSQNAPYGYPVDATKFKVLMATFKDGVLSAYRLENGAVVLGATRTITRTASVNTELIGGSRGIALSGSLDIAMVAKHRKACTLSELSEICAYLSSFAKNKGLPLM